MKAYAKDAVDLSALSTDARTNLEVALVRGAAWEWMGQDDPEPFCALRLAGVVIAGDGDGLTRHPVRYFGPDYLTSPAAWGALMEKERIAVSPAFSTEHDTPWEARFHPLRDERYIDDAVRGSIGEAVCAAVLAKHGVEV